MKSKVQILKKALILLLALSMVLPNLVYATEEAIEAIAEGERIEGTITADCSDITNINYSVTVTIDFGVAVDELEYTDVRVTNGTVVHYYDENDGVVLIIEQIDEGELTVTLPEDSCFDSNGNGNKELTKTIIVDRTKPEVEITALQKQVDGTWKEIEDNKANRTSDIEISMMFSEPVKVTSFASIKEYLNTNTGLAFVYKYEDVRGSINICDGYYDIEYYYDLEKYPALDSNNDGKVTSRDAYNHFQSWTFGKEVSSQECYNYLLSHIKGIKFTVTSLTEGELKLNKPYVTFMDLAGNRIEDGEYSIEIDPKLVATITAVDTEDLTNKDQIEFEVVFNENIERSHVHFEVNNGEVSENTMDDVSKINYTVTNLTDGELEITLSYSDLEVKKIITIDKTAPVGTITYSTEGPTNGNVTATITFNEENVTITNNEGRNTYVFEQNESFTFEFKDAAGNEGEATARVNNIDKTEPQIVFKDLKIQKVEEKDYVKVSAGMTKDEIIGKMDKDALKGIVPEFTNLTKDGKIKTGTEIKINEEVVYTVVVKGDVDGDGAIDFNKDILRANNGRLKLITLSTIQNLAADVDDDGTINFNKDILRINNFRLGLINSL